MQACFYNYLIGKYKTIHLRNSIIINKDMEILEYEYNHYKEELFKQISKIKKKY